MIERDNLHAYADGEVEPEERARIEATMTSADREYVASIRAYRAELPSRLAPVDVGEAWIAARGRIHELDKARRVERFVGRWAWAGVAVFSLLIVGTGIKNRSFDPGRIDSPDLARMAAVMGGASRTKGAPAEDVQRAYFDSLLARAAATIDPNRLTMTRPAVEATIDGRRLTRLWLRDVNGDLGLIVLEGGATLPDFVPMGGGYLVGQVGTENCVAWGLEGSTLLLTGPRSTADLRAVAERIIIPK